MAGPHVRFEAIYDAFYRPVWAYCARRMPRARVDDAVSEVFAVAWRRIDDVPSGNAALPWLYGVAFRVVSQQRRSGRRRGAMERRLRGMGVPAALGVESQVVERVEYRMVRRAAERLSARDQEVLRLSLWEELSHAEAAEVLGISVDAVKQRLHRAKARLARRYRRLEQQKDGAAEGGEA